MCVTDSQVFNRQDMLYVGTSGQQGTAPSQISKCYPSAGIITMRSDWGNVGQPYTDSRYAMFHGVHYGAHGHADLNAFASVYAYGRELLTDPGSYIYGSPEHDLICESVSHNLMTVDGQNENQGGDTHLLQWNTDSRADYVSSRVPGYGAGGYVREVFYIRSNGDAAQDYWVVRDKAEGSGTHSLEQRWHFRPVTVTVDGSLTASTGFTDGAGNLSVMQIDPTRLQAQQTTISGWLNGSTNPLSLLPTIIYKVNAALPAGMDTVLIPYMGTQNPAQLTVISKASDGLDSVFKIVQGNIQDIFIIQRSTGARTVGSEGISFDGDKLFVRKVNGVLRSAVAVNAKQLTVDGRQVLNQSARQAWYSASF
jgi:hypothetical protein